MLPHSRNWPWIWAPWLLSRIKSFTNPCHWIFTAALAAPADTGFLVLLPCLCHWFCLCRKFVSLKWNGHFLFFCLSAVRGSLSQNPSETLGLPHFQHNVPCLSQSCAVLSLALQHVFARHRGVAYHCWAGASVPDSACLVFDGQNGWIAKWMRGRRPHDLCTCFRLEGSVRQEPAFESACLELGWA